MTKIIVISAPRSGTHMLVRMISKSQFLPWFVPVPVKKISQIKESSWVIGLHDKYENVLQNCPQNTKIICIKRILGHEQSLNKINIKKNFLIDEIINSMPEELTVIYDEIIKESKIELEKIKKILDIENIEYEPWEQRYTLDSSWRKHKYDENNPKLI